MEWIESRGGPLVLVPRMRLSSWCGVEGSQTEEGTDYDRACQVHDEVGVITVAESAALVLGDEPFRTAWVPRHDGAGWLVRWVYADSEESVRSYLSEQDGDSWEWTGGVRFEALGPCVMFDAAESGGKFGGGAIQLELRPGPYTVRTAVVDASSEVRLLVHELKPGSYDA